ncbi:hypothetical protein ACQPZJ_36890 [Actinoplanes sp. CA-054009]
MPGVLTLAAAAALTVVAATRAGNAVLIGGAVLVMLSSVTAVEDLARLYGLLPEPEPSTVVTGCIYSYSETPAPSVGRAAVDIAVALLFLSAPAMIAWSATRLRGRPVLG